MMRTLLDDLTIRLAEPRIKVRHIRVESIGLLAILGYSLAYGLIHQPYFPVTWLDEGFVLQGALNLVRFGKYGMLSSEGMRLFDQPLIANGPGIVLPISLSFQLFGIGLLQARFVMVIFLILSIFVFYLLGRYLFGVIPALIACILVLFIPNEGVLFLGRQAIGIIPGLFYFLLGLLLWFKAIDLRNWLYTIGAGIFFGLAVITKGQYMLLVPVLFLVGLADFIYYKSKAWQQILLILGTIIACALIWYGVQYLVLGHEGFINNLGALRSSTNETVAAFRPARIPGNLWYLIRSGIMIVILPGWLVLTYVSRERNSMSVRLLLPLCFVPIWLAWFAFVSVGLHRYSLDPYVVGALFSGLFILGLVDTLRERKLLNHLSRLQKAALQMSGWGYIAVIVVFTLVGFGFQIKLLSDKPDTSPQVFAGYLAQNIGPSHVIESWEWELDALSPGLTYHHPTNQWVDLMTRKLQFNEPVSDTYDPVIFHPEFLVDGPFSKWTGLYSPFLEQGCCELKESVGNYDLYLVRSPGSP